MYYYKFILRVKIAIICNKKWQNFLKLAQFAWQYIYIYDRSIVEVWINWYKGWMIKTSADNFNHYTNNNYWWDYNSYY